MTEPTPSPAPERTGRFAAVIAGGILLSRIAGLVRLRALAHFFGTTAAADAVSAALRIPNFLQNLFGEGALSASFIPAYARLRAQGDDEGARRLAAAVFALLAALMAALVLMGVAGAPWLVRVLTPGFDAERRALTVQLVRIMFPGVGLLALSAWCLGVLNSHRRFFLSYASPVLWNAAIIGALFAGAVSRSGARLAIWVAIGALVGSVLQFAVQLPRAFELARPLWGSSATGDSGALRGVIRNFGPAFLGRGVVQISAFVDQSVASLLPIGSLTALANAQMIFTLPVSLFGMSVAAAELPAMSGVAAGPDPTAALRDRVDAGLARVAFFTVPSAIGMLAHGDVMAAALLQTGAFRRADAIWVWGILAAASIGLVSTTSARLYSSVLYALHDTRTPLRYACVRIALSVALALPLALWLPERLGIEPRWGVAGITLASALAGWLEWWLLRRATIRRLGPVRMGGRVLGALVIAALAGALIAWGVRFALPPLPPVVRAIPVLGLFALSYGVVALALGVAPARRVYDALQRRIRARLV